MLGSCSIGVCSCKQHKCIEQGELGLQRHREWRKHVKDKRSELEDCSTEISRSMIFDSVIVKKFIACESGMWIPLEVFSLMLPVRGNREAVGWSKEKEGWEAISEELETGF